jgi:hypothetical protein
VRHRVTYENLAGAVIDKSGQAVFVSANVEDREIANRIGMGVSFPHIDDTRPPRSLDSPVPVV